MEGMSAGPMPAPLVEEPPVSRLSDTDRDLLMELQYHFPLTRYPFEGVAEALGRREEAVLADTQRLLRWHVIKRIGFNVNFKTYGLEGALVGVACPSSRFAELRDAFLPLDVITHNYVRSHPRFQVWFTYKASSPGQLLAEIAHLLGRLGLEDYVVLRSRRTYAVRVKFDLYQGISRSPEPLSRYVLPERVVAARDLGISEAFLEGLGEGLRAMHDPYRTLLEATGMGSREFEEWLPKLLDLGVLRNGGATLRGPVLGFTHNAMMVFRTNDPAGTCRCLAEECAEATHVVLREPLLGTWNHPGYIMLHATSHDRVVEVSQRISQQMDLRDYQLIFSLQNLKP
jgi:DNA-binding Lrp family transcriptional regulator